MTTKPKSISQLSDMERRSISESAQGKFAPPPTLEELTKLVERDRLLSAEEMRKFGWITG